MSIQQTIPPLPDNAAIVDPKTGFVTIAFQQWWQQLTQNGDFTFDELDGKVPNTRLINTTAPLTGGGALSGDLTLGTTIVFGVVLDGSGSTITTGVKDYLPIMVAHTITKVTCLSIDAAVTSCSITVDVWRDSYANFPPTSGDKISASAPVTLSSATKSQDSILTGWSKTGAAGDIYGFSVATVTSAKKILIMFEATV